jgi:hypothetical protein
MLASCNVHGGWHQCSAKCVDFCLPNLAAAADESFEAPVAGTVLGLDMSSQMEPEGALIGANAERRTDQRCYGLVNSRICAQNPFREVTLEVGQRDIRIRRSFKAPSVSTQIEYHGAVRNPVSKFTPSSKRRLLFTARNFPGLEIMLTLTYPADFPMNGRTVKNHWRRFRQWMIRNGATTGLWVLEFQRRGAPHFHIFIREALDRLAVSRAWYRIVGSNDPKHLAAGTRIEEFRKPAAIGSYVMKYAAKMEQKEVPAGYASVGRFWATWGNPKLVEKLVLPQHMARHLVRPIRNAHRKIRRTWTSHKQFRDNGKSGFIAWETSTTVRRMLDDFFDDGVMFPT